MTAIKKPNNYANTQEYGTGKSLPPGGYVVGIVKIEETKSKKGLPQLKVAFDIAEGEYQGYFREIFNKRKAERPFEAKWPNGGMSYINIEDDKGQCHRSFKSFCGALEKCGYTVWDMADNFLIDQIVGKTVGLTFGREEYEWDGKTGWATKPRFFCSIEDIHNGDFNVPEDRPLAKETLEPSRPEGFTALSENDIPF